MPKPDRAAAPVLDVGDFCIVHYSRRRRYRARVTGLQPPFLLIAHVSADGRLVIDPDDTTRLFQADTLVSVNTTMRGGRVVAVAHLEPEPKEERDDA